MAVSSALACESPQPASQHANKHRIKKIFLQKLAEDEVA
jgi:hypothetical protein